MGFDDNVVDGVVADGDGVNSSGTHVGNGDVGDLVGFDVRNLERINSLVAVEVGGSYGVNSCI